MAKSAREIVRTYPAVVNQPFFIGGAMQDFIVEFVMDPKGVAVRK